MTRSSSKYPPHIDPGKLPANVYYYDPRGRGRWSYRKSHGRGNRGKETRLGDSSLTLAEIWRRIEELAGGIESTFRAISLEFRNSSDWVALSRPTQKDYENCHKAVCERETRAGSLLGDIPPLIYSPHPGGTNMAWKKFDRTNIPFGRPVFIKGSLDGSEIMKLVVIEDDQCTGSLPGAIPVPWLDDESLLCITMDDEDPSELTIHEFHELIMPGGYA